MPQYFSPEMRRKPIPPPFSGVVCSSKEKNMLLAEQPAREKLQNSLGEKNSSISVSGKKFKDIFYFETKMWGFPFKAPR
ncbi:hypothetical protein MAR_ORF177 [Marseillevirus marseillevirus]|uniref:Uncharacterized protein n=1 Tax=Marseillevirus marseillevirus TaxID=694581 RepID=D2XAI1_GBMV|nr:hypothetical protein MAR_ORF177 [Marseillevirus marseillevirus]ADB03958.1 hypothetical protein MAR_ORF177 [Marseillevirus marseillevirus]